MRWTSLAFLHWPVGADVLRPLIPPSLDLDTYDGHAWVGIVPFRMEGVRVRGVPPVPTAHDFAELNVRTYVRAGGLGGVWFFSLDAASRLAVRGARFLYNLPYYDAEIHLSTPGDAVEYRSRRTHQGAPAAEFEATYGPVSDVYQAEPGTLDHFLVERYRLFTHSPRRGLGAIEIDHEPWPLQRGEASIIRNRMTQAFGLELPAVAPIVHVAGALDVRAWMRRAVAPDD